MTTFEAASLTAQVDTEAEAHVLMSALKHKFNLVGTTFWADDLDGILESADVPEGKTREAAIERMMASQVWLRLEDRLAQSGNFILDDLAADTVEEMTEE